MFQKLRKQIDTIYLPNLDKSCIQKSGTVRATLKRFDICLKRGLAQGLDVD
ncbi:hypothetical protein [Bartonella grahamii]|uniref:hypothetical protein n=1 Tax=Bartonella grahamii TaxID=33045 RepID=UPI0002D79666|nr:hypothetical protein [Bartonella grahamii]